MGHVYGPVGGPFREDRDPCVECARREAAAKRVAEARAAQPSWFREWWGLVVFGGLGVAAIVAAAAHDFGGDKSTACYFASEHADFTGHVYRTIPYTWGKPGEVDMRTFPSIEAARAFLVEKKAKVCP